MVACAPMTDTSVTGPAPIPPPQHRLPYTVEPRRYALRLAPDLEAATFSGEVHIEVLVHEAVDEHRPPRSRADHRQRPRWSLPAATPQPADRRARRGDRTTRPRPGGTARPGPGGRSRIAFSGVLNDKLHGFYRSTFTDDDGVTHTIATTQFEATDARRAFPCFDEPDRKAVFARHPRRARRSRRPTPTAPWSRTLAAARRRPTGPLRRHHGRCPPTSWPSSSGPRGHRPGRRRRHPGPHRPRAGQGRPDRVRPRGCRPRPALLHRLVRHRLPGREARPRRHPRLRLRGHGEPGVRDLPRGRAPGRPRTGRRASSSSGSPTSSPTRSPTCGSGTSSPCSGGTASG